MSRHSATCLVLRENRFATHIVKTAQAGSGREVLLWPDTWNNYFHPAALTAAAKVLESSGSRVTIPTKHICCGRPLYDFGFLDEARRYLLRIWMNSNLKSGPGVPVVMLEPSCASVFRDELVNLFPKDERALRLSQQTMMLSEMLAQSLPSWRPPQFEGRRIIVHGHCHQKAIMSMKDEMSLLRATGADVEMLDSAVAGWRVLSVSKKRTTIFHKSSLNVSSCPPSGRHRRYNLSKQRIQLPRTN